MVAIENAAGALVKCGYGSLRREFRQAALRSARRAAAALLIAILPFAYAPAHAASNKVRITNLGDVAFGSLANLGVDAVRSQNICVFADTSANGYNVTATGTGPGGSFRLASGTRTMAFDVQWSSSTGQSSGSQLTPNVPLTGQVSPSTHQSCSSGPASSASLIIVLRSSVLSSATAGTYDGSLTLLIGPE
ncbi:MAG: hypothetical protein ACJ8EH_00295 [Sphingomicrobium sp.]